MISDLVSLTMKRDMLLGIIPIVIIIIIFTERLQILNELEVTERILKDILGELKPKLGFQEVPLVRGTL